jgi:peroxiredoxin
VSAFHSRLLIAAGVAASLMLGGCNASKPVKAAASAKPDKDRKPAPEFELKDADGKTVRLSDYKGKVVLLDFWATWCGPCVQAMPQVERAAGEFRDQNVRLIAVNLQETAEQVTAMLERQKLHVTVALDRDGVVAENYKAAAIPQTVIINRDGNVARLFVGGGPHLEDQLKEAIKAVLNGDKPPEPKK